MVSDHALLIAGWTGFVIFAFASSCLILYLLLTRHKTAKASDQAADIELQSHERATIDPPKQQLPVSILDPFTTQGVLSHAASKTRPGSLLRTSPERDSEPDVVAGAQERVSAGEEEGHVGKRIAGADLPMHVLEEPVGRASQELGSLCDTPFSETFPDTWGKVG